MDKIIPTEAQEQAALVQWLEANRLKFTAIPNSTYTKSWKQKTKNKQQGLRAGLPDLLIVTKKHLLFVEMKRQKRSVTSQAQKDWIEALNNINPSIIATVCKGYDEAIEFITKYK